MSLGMCPSQLKFEFVGFGLLYFKSVGFEFGFRFVTRSHLVQFN